MCNKCTECGGEGNEERICWDCNGSGEGKHGITICPKCKGLGTLLIDCHECGGYGSCEH